MPWQRIALACAAGALSAGLVACAPADPDETQATKRELFASYQARMQAIGYLRTDAEAADIPFTNDQLARNFQRIAFFTYPGDTERIAKPLTRWQGPIRYAVLGTDGDQTEVDALMRRLARLTGLDIRPARPGRANFVVVAYDDTEQALAAQAVEEQDQRQFMIEFFEEIFDCGAITAWSEDDPVIRQALVYLHGDLEGLYRTLCFHEEIAQSLGLFNDDPEVRPSIFNDDDQFALLTTHDELLLRILDDPRLRAGMRPDEAMPLVARIIADLRPGGAGN